MRAFAYLLARLFTCSTLLPGAQCDIHLLEVAENASRGFASGLPPYDFSPQIACSWPAPLQVDDLVPVVSILPFHKKRWYKNLPIFSGFSLIPTKKYRVPIIGKVTCHTRCVASAWGDDGADFCELCNILECSETFRLVLFVFSGVHC